MAEDFRDDLRAGALVLPSAVPRMHSGTRRPALEAAVARPTPFGPPSGGVR